MNRESDAKTDESAARERETSAAAESRRLVLNPTSGRGNHVERVRELADQYGFPIVETEHAGHGTRLAEQAVADGVDLLAVCGGDGTLHEVVQGLVAAEGLDDVTLCVVPAGTENFFAQDLGIGDVEDGFAVAERGETRQLDLGVAGDEPFVLSAIAGLPADASAAATHERKHSLGPVAFLVAGVEKAMEFDGLHVEIDAFAAGEEAEAGEEGEAAEEGDAGGDGEKAEAEGGEEYVWSGEAEAILVGNARRFAGGGGQADAEDGLLEVAIVEQLPAHEALVEYVEQRVFEWDTDHVTELRARRLDFESLDGEPVTFSLDGEIREFERVQIGVRPGALRVKVGEAYEPNP